MLRQPLLNLATSTLTTVNSQSDTFVFPFQDFDGIIAKLTMTTLTNTGSYTVYFQTTDDGGTTWYDMQASTVINSASTMTNAAAQWFTIPVNPTYFVNKATLSDGTLAAASSGIPLLSNQLRVKWAVTGTITTVSGKVVLSINNQSNRS